MRRRSEVDEERVRRSRYIAPVWKKDRRVPVADPGRPTKEETAVEAGVAAEEERETQRELVML